MEREKHRNESNAQKNRLLIEVPINWKERRISCQTPEGTAGRQDEIYPPARLHHCSVFYKNKIFIWGGNIATEDPKPKTLFLYAFQIDSKKWKRIWTKTNYKDLEAIEGQCHAAANNRWYMYGGTNRAGHCSPHLWRLNLDSFEWIKCEQKGDPPRSTEGGQLVAFEKNWLLHYEGFSARSGHSTHPIHIYYTDSKTWYRCEGNYEFYLSYRLGTALCVQNARIYMFGGVRETEDGLEYLNDLYELKVNSPNKPHRTLEAYHINSTAPVPGRAEHTLLPLGKDYLCLIGGRNADEHFADIWIYGLKSGIWSKEVHSSFLAQKRIGYSCVFGANQVFLFGGIKQLNQSHVMTNDLWRIEVQFDKQAQTSEDNECTDTFIHSCCLCFEKKNNFAFAARPFSSQLIKHTQQTSQFPFAAFGLLLDNCLMLGATDIIVQINTDSSSLHYIKIEDNGKPSWEESEFFASILSFCSQNQMILLGCDKRVKRNIVKSNLLREYGVNFKLGCLQLGKRFLLISYSIEVLRVCLLYEDNANEEWEDRQYLVQYYAWSEERKELLHPSMASSREFIDLEYLKLIREVVNSRTHKTVLYIFDTIIDNEDGHLSCRKDLNDLIYGKPEDIEALQQRGYYVQDSIDVSLQAYLSSLYLKNENLAIYLGVEHAALTNLPINLQKSLEKIDRLSWMGSAVELEGVIEFDFKFAEFYYLRDIKPSLKFFNNGILLYYKNRLICRHRPNLGDMVAYLLDQQQDNSLQFFGFAELPENIPLNASKTAFAFTIMLEKMYSRFKFIEESFIARSKRFRGAAEMPNPKARPNDEPDQPIHRGRRIYGTSVERPKRNLPEVNHEEPPLRKKSRKNEKAEFTPPYKVRDSEFEARRTRQQVNTLAQAANSEQNLRVLIEHDQSSIQQYAQDGSKTQK